MINEQDNFAFPSSGDPETDRRTADSIRIRQTLLDADMCSNGCGSLTWEEAYNAECPACRFGWSVNTPYGKHLENEAIQ